MYHDPFLIFLHWNDAGFHKDIFHTSIWCNLSVFPAYPTVFPFSPLPCSHCSPRQFWSYFHTTLYAYIKSTSHKHRKMQYLSFWDQLNPLNMITFSYIHFPSNNIALSFFMAEKIPLHFLYCSSVADPLIGPVTCEQCPSKQWCPGIWIIGWLAALPVISQEQCNWLI